jgi:hypothetical protein
MSNVILFLSCPANRKPDVVTPSIETAHGSPDMAYPFREIKRFTIPIEEKIFVAISNNKEVHVYQSRDDGQTWALALVTSVAEYRCWMSAFWIDDPDCQNSKTFLEMVRFLQSGYVLPNGLPVPNWSDPSKKWTEIQRSGAGRKKWRERQL